MDIDRIEFLKIKRDLFKRETQLKGRRNRIFTELNYLQKNNLHYNLYYDLENVNWINNNIKVRKKDGYRGIHGDFQIDVDDMEALHTEKGNEENCFQYKSILEFFNEISNDTMLIRCSLFGDTEIEITKYAFLSQPSLFFSEPDTWILSSDKKYIIERISNKEVVRFIDITKEEPILRVKLLLSYE